MNNISLREGSSVLDNVDATVNAANRNLLAGSGVCGAIFAQAGLEQLQESCDKVIENMGRPLADGEAVITPAFGIKTAKYIIHAVGPNFNVTPDAFDKLFQAYYNSMNLLKENNLHSIAFPLISSGIFAGRIDKPAYVSTKKCIEAYNKFVEENPNYEIDVRIFSFNTNTLEECQRAFDENSAKVKII
jgi:O-acetyl-ADP-ribose deacetylase (regulator of RNase III)